MPCRLGSASICAVDDECGTNISADLGTTTESCYKVGSGALSKIIIFGLDLYANIAGEADSVGESETDIVIINAAKSDSTSIRLNWRENF